MRAYTPEEQTMMKERVKAFFDFLSHTQSENPINNPIDPAILVRDTLGWPFCYLPQSFGGSDIEVSGQRILEDMSQVLRTIPLETFFTECEGDRKAAIREAIELMTRFVFQADWSPIISQAFSRTTSND